MFLEELRINFRCQEMPGIPEVLFHLPTLPAPSSFISCPSASSASSLYRDDKLIYSIQMDYVYKYVN